jgi:hypothetical protein
MVIHHYTNIETLAMILSTKSLKFNRLDCVISYAISCRLISYVISQIYTTGRWYYIYKHIDYEDTNRLCNE